MFMRQVHPGSALQDELAELGNSPTEFARQINVPANRVSQIIAGKRSITGDTALRLGHWFGTEAQFWLHLQSQFDLALASQVTGEAVRRLPTKNGLSSRNEIRQAREGRQGRLEQGIHEALTRRRGRSPGPSPVSTRDADHAQDGRPPGQGSGRRAPLRGLRPSEHVP